MKPAKLLKRYRVEHGKGFKLKHYDPADDGGLTLAREEAAVLLDTTQRHLAEMQDKLYAQDRWSVLCIFQAMDAAGKDSTIRHVFSGLNPQGCEVTSFKAPTALELDQDYLRRHIATLPRRGHIGIHNRSWYEEVLVTRVHPAILERQKLPPELMGKHIFRDRLEDIAAVERYIARQGTIILKFFLHVSPEEQRRRFLSRIEEPAKNWKFSPDDVMERQHWAEYQAAYQDAIQATAAPYAPWYVVPADRKWFMQLVVAEAIMAAMEPLGLAYPEPDEAMRVRLEEARRLLG